LATREAGLVTIAEEAGSTINVGESGLMISFKLVGVGIEDIGGTGTDSLTGFS